MSLSAEAIDALVRAGVTAEQLGAALIAEMKRDAEREARQVPWPKLRAMAFARDGHRCGYCASEAGPFEVDHVKPRSRGGEDVLENVVVACAACNRAKKDRDPQEWADAKDRRERDRLRKAEKRARVRGQSADSADTTDVSADPLQDKEGPPDPLRKPNYPAESISTREEPSRAEKLAQVAVLRRAFEGFWAEYPRRVAKPDAERAYAKALAKPGVDPTVILAGLRRHLGGWATGDPSFVPHPATWLNRDGWNDEADQPRNQRPQGARHDHRSSPGHDRLSAIGRAMAEGIRDDLDFGLPADAHPH